MSYPFTRYTRQAFCQLCNVVYLFEPKHLTAHVEYSGSMGHIWMKADGTLLPCPKGHAILTQTTRPGFAATSKRVRKAPRLGYLESIGNLDDVRRARQ